MGHVVNEAFSDRCIVQRKDVDGFYGSVAESEFQRLLECKARPFHEVLSDPHLSKNITVQLTSDGEKVDVYHDAGSRSPDHTPIRIEDTSGNAISDFVAKLSKDDAAAAHKKNWAIGVNMDCEASGLASLIKAAHLSMFFTLGYRYALSAAGEYVGRQILRGFYVQNRGKPMKEAKQAAEKYFHDFINMVRPLYCADNLRGTIEDHKIHVFHASNGEPFGLGVLVRMREKIFHVLVPMVPANGDAMATYLDFLRNDNEFFWPRQCDVNEVDRYTRSCEYEDEQFVRHRWPKDRSG
jgi:hypothetical protein